MTEIIETNVMLSELYFNKSAKVLNFFKENNHMYGFYILYKIFSNESNLIQWRSRLSMDIFARFCGSFLCTIMYLVRFSCYGQHYMNSHFSNDFFQKSMTLTMIYGGQDMLHYICTIIYVEKYFRFNMLSQFVEHFDQMTTSQLCFVVTVYLCMFVSLFAYQYG
eukprot:468069_1